MQLRLFRADQHGTIRSCRFQLRDCETWGKITGVASCSCAELRSKASTSGWSFFSSNDSVEQLQLAPRSHAAHTRRLNAVRNNSREQILNHFPRFVGWEYFCFQKMAWNFKTKNEISFCGRCKYSTYEIAFDQTQNWTQQKRNSSEGWHESCYASRSLKNKKNRWILNLLTFGCSVS